VGEPQMPVIDRCQVCDWAPLRPVLSLGYMPPCNQLVAVDAPRQPQSWFPTDLLLCENCELVQLGFAADPATVFPESYPYTSGSTQLLRDNFADLFVEVSRRISLSADDLVVDIGSNDGTLLGHFKASGCRLLGVEPTATARIAQAAGIETWQRFFDLATATDIRRERGQARVITMANCFAHIDDVHQVMHAVNCLLASDGIFVSESHDLIGLLQRVQYDTIYHEHLRYYSVTSIALLLAMHNFEICDVSAIPTHGGSIRVTAARRGFWPISPKVRTAMATEPRGPRLQLRLDQFRRDVVASKLKLLTLIAEIKAAGRSICAIGAPSRAATLVQYVGLDADVIDYVCERRGSLKLGKYLPGTLIPVVDEARLYAEQPDYALLLSWHLTDGLVAALRTKGYHGQFIVPLPAPQVLGREGE
jgi:C-methyltransferase C-terminal domain/Methyltransferase domain/Putative zinc binding domain